MSESCEQVKGSNHNCMLVLVVDAFGQQLNTFEEPTSNMARPQCILDTLIRKISPDPIGLHGLGAIENYIPKFQVTTMSLEVA